MSEYASVAGQRVLVVGGARGIGKAIVKRLAQQKAIVTLTARDLARAQQVAAEMVASAGNSEVHSFQLDVTDNTDSDLNQWLVNNDLPDTMIFNAGVSPSYSRPEKVTDQEWDLIFNTNLRGAFIAARCYARQLLKQSRPGSIIFINSIAGLVGAKRLSAYAASKHGLTGLVKNLAMEWAENKIRVNGVAPGWVRTDLTAGLQQNPILEQQLIDSVPMAYLAEPEDIADIAVFLSSHSARYVTGATWSVDGGLTCG
ncbi:MAG: SDR family oxidoreductase [Immundisolibacteraceae bacterium]|nr:SDR family oxidoreductase [Immundisolibacteraceae bacterium]